MHPVWKIRFPWPKLVFGTISLETAVDIADLGTKKMLSAQLPDAEVRGWRWHQVIRNLCEHVRCLILQWPKLLGGRRENEPFIKILNIFLNLKKSLTHQRSFKKKSASFQNKGWGNILNDTLKKFSNIHSFKWSTNRKNGLKIDHF